MEGFTLEAVLGAMLVSGGMGYPVFYVWNKIEKWWPALVPLDFDIKRILIFILALIMIQAPYWFSILATFHPCPTTWIVWLSETFFYASTSFVVATVKHGAAKAKAKVACC